MSLKKRMIESLKMPSKISRAFFMLIGFDFEKMNLWILDIYLPPSITIKTPFFEI